MELIRIALKNLNRQKKRSILLGGAIAFGVMIVTVIQGFSGAFMSNVSQNFANLVAGHVFIEGVEKSPSGRSLNIIKKDELLLKALEESGVRYKYLTKRSSFSATLIFESMTATQAIQGVDLRNEKFLTERLILKKGSFEGMSDRRGLILSEKIATKLKVEVGDRILVQLSSYTGQQNVGEFVLAATILDSGILSTVSAYANLDYVSELLNMKQGEYMTLGLYLDSLEGMDKIADSYYAKLKDKALVFDREKAKADANPLMTLMKQAKGETWKGTKYRVYTLNDMLKQAEQIVTILNGASFIILLILFLIIMVGITNTFRMIMFERIREIGTMRAIGMQRKGIRNLFLLEALFLALGGAIAGFVLAGVIMLSLSFINFGMDSFIFILLKNGHLSFSVKAVQMALTVFIIGALTLLAALLPARKAARLKPAEALRTAK